MVAFALRRLVQFVPTVLAVLCLLFFLLNILPGNAALTMGDAQSGIDPLVLERMQREMGLDRSVPERFVSYVAGLAHGDLGTSFQYKEKVTTLVGARVWPTLKLAGAAMLIALALGIPLGFLAATRQGTWLDPVLMVGAVSGVSVPQFWLGLLLIYLCAVKAQLLPTSGYGEGSTVYLLLPALTLGLAYTALLARTTRAAVIEVLSADYVRTARAKGLTSWRIQAKHVLRNALILITTTAGLQFGALMGQTVIVEKLFAWPGLGSLLVESIFLRDLPVTQGCVLLLVAFFLIVNFAIDLLYAVIDPRVQY